MTNPVFSTPVKNPFGLTDVGLSASPTFADIDGDGDLDVFVGESNGNTLFYRNTGTVNSPVFSDPVTNPFGLTDVGYGSEPTFADIDGDGDLDAFFGERYGNTLFYSNIGTVDSPQFSSPITNPFGLTDVGSYSAPTFADIDGDGDLDAFFGEASGNTLFFRNTGTVDSPKFSAPITNPFGLTNVDSYSAPNVADIDNDGDLDVFVGDGQGGNTLLYMNSGTVGSPKFSAPITNPFGLTDVGDYVNPTFADIDSDGDLDAFVGDGDGTTLLFLNTANDAPTATNISQTIAYTEDKTAAIADIVITDPNLSNVFTSTVTLAGGNSAIGSLSATSGHGETFTAATGVWTVSGTLADVNAALAAMTFVPKANVFANTSALVSVSDGIAPGLTGTLIFNGKAVNDAPVGSATATLLAGTEDTAYTVIATNLLKGFSDVDGDSLTVSDLAANHGTVVNNNDGSYTITPELNYNGILSLTYNVSDGKVGGLAATQSFNLAAVNDAPVGSATALLAAGKEDTAYVLSTETLLQGFSDVDGDSLSVSGLVADHATVKNKNGTFTLTPDANYSGLIKLSYNVIDGKGGSIAATQSFSLGATNDAPVLTTPAAITYVDTIKNDLFPLSVNLLTLSNADHGALTYGITGGVDNADGTVSLSSAYGVLTLSKATGAYVFVPDDAAIEALKANATAAFTVSVTDGGLTDSETLTVTINQQGKTESLGNDKLTGGSANEAFNGLAGKDSIVGGAGNDSVNGGTGNDKLTGGSGLDVFIFDTAPLANVDSITDFVVADDTIQLENAIFNQLTVAGALNPTNFVIGASALDSNDFVVYNPANGALLYDADGNGAGIAVSIATLGVNLALTAADFVVS